MKIADTPLVARARENIKPARPTLTLNRKIMKYFSEIFYWMQSKAPAPLTPSARLFSMTAFGHSFVKGINHLKTPLTNFTVLKIIYSSFLQCMMSNKSPVQPRRGESRNSLILTEDCCNKGESNKTGLKISYPCKSVNRDGLLKLLVLILLSQTGKLFLL